MTFFFIETKEAFIIDPVLDYDPFSNNVHPLLANAIIQFVENHGLNVSKIIDTHVHAVSFPTFYKNVNIDKLFLGSLDCCLLLEE